MSRRFVTLYDGYDKKSSFTLKSGKRARARKIELQELSEEIERRKRNTTKAIKKIIGEIRKKSVKGRINKTLVLHWTIGKKIAVFKDFLAEHFIRDVCYVEYFMKECGITETKIFQMERFYRIFKNKKKMVAEMEGIISWTAIRKIVLKREEFEILESMILEEYGKMREKKRKN